MQAVDAKCTGSGIKRWRALGEVVAERVSGLRVGGGGHDPGEELVQGVAEVAVEVQGDADALLGDVAGDAESALGFPGDRGDDAAGGGGAVAGEPAEHPGDLGHDAEVRRHLLRRVVRVGEPELAVGGDGAVVAQAFGEIIEERVPERGGQGLGGDEGAEHVAGRLVAEGGGYLADVVLGAPAQRPPAAERPVVPQVGQEGAGEGGGELSLPGGDPVAVVAGD